MLGSFSIASLGLLLGMRHALDPDHVVAVTTISAHDSSLRRSAALGALWGVGHTVTLMVAGGALILFRVAISPRMGLALEFSVAIMLIVLGLLNLRPEREKAADSSASRNRPLFVGMVHGLAGSAAVALLVLATVTDPRWALLYLLLFGGGTVIGMVLVTSAVAVPVRIAASQWNVPRRWFVVASGVASVAFGVALALQLTGPDGLLAANPIYTPH